MIPANARAAVPKEAKGDRRKEEAFERPGKLRVVAAAEDVEEELYERARHGALEVVRGLKAFEEMPFKTEGKTFGRRQRGLAKPNARFGLTMQLYF